MEKITKRLIELFNDKEFDKNNLIQYLGLKEDTLFYIWKRGESVPSLINLDKLARFFRCSMEYLFGRTEDFGDTNYEDIKPFNKQLKKIMAEKKVTQYKMIVKDKICTSSHFQKWFKKNSIPTPETLIKLADYFNVTVDYLLGRE